MILLLVSIICLFLLIVGSMEPKKEIGSGEPPPVPSSYIALVMRHDSVKELVWDKSVECWVRRVK